MNDRDCENVVGTLSPRPVAPHGRTDAAKQRVRGPRGDDLLRPSPENPDGRKRTEIPLSAANHRPVPIPAPSFAFSYTRGHLSIYPSFINMGTPRLEKSGSWNSGFLVQWRSWPMEERSR
jgi:hypothetical protein